MARVQRRGKSVEKTAKTFRIEFNILNDSFVHLALRSVSTVAKASYLFELIYSQARHPKPAIKTRSLRVHIKNLYCRWHRLQWNQGVNAVKVAFLGTSGVSWRLPWCRLDELLRSVKRQEAWKTLATGGETENVFLIFEEAKSLFLDHLICTNWRWFRLSDISFILVHYI